MTELNTKRKNIWKIFIRKFQQSAEAWFEMLPLEPIIRNNRKKPDAQKNAASFWNKQEQTVSGLFNIGLVSLALAQRLVLGLAGVPQQEGDAQGGQSHHSEREPVQLKKG